MKKKFKNIGILACLAILFLFVSDAFAPWRYNPFTRKLDYYSIDIGTGLTGEAAGDVLFHDGTNWTNLTAGANGLVLTLVGGLPTWVGAGAPGAHAATHELLGADLVDHDNLTNFVAAEHLLVGAIDHDSLLNYLAGQHIGLPNTIATVLSDHSFTLGVDVGAVPDYFGVAGGDGLFRFTANHFTMADGGNFVTLSLADHATARTALGLGAANDVQFADIHHTAFISTVYYNNGNSGAAKTIDWNNGNLQYITIDNVGVDITFTEPPNPGDCELWVIQDGTGDRTIDWEHEVSPKWPGGVEPTLSTGAGDIDVFVFTFIGGTTYRGLFNGNFE